MTDKKRKAIISVTLVILTILVTQYFGCVIAAFGVWDYSYNPDVYLSSEDGEYTLLLQEGSFFHSQKIEIRLKNGDEWTDYKGCLSFEYMGVSLLNERLYEVKWEEDKVTLILLKKDSDELVEWKTQVIMLQGGENE